MVQDMGFCEMTEAERAQNNLRKALAFFDRVEATVGDERTALGTDHIRWLERAARRMAAADLKEDQ